MATSTIVRTCSVACLSSAVTILILLILVVPRNDNSISSFVDRMRNSHSSVTSAIAPGPEACSNLKSSQGLFPQEFVESPWRHPVYSRNESFTKKVWWDSLLTPNGGFLMVEEQNREVVKYGVSMFHQLHCLSMIRNMLLTGNMHPGDVDVEDHDSHNHEKEQGHWWHCFDYIVQAIICTADDAIERTGKVLVPGGEEIDGINGMGQTHQCRNATYLYEYLLQSEHVPVKAASVGRYSVFS